MGNELILLFTSHSVNFSFGHTKPKQNHKYLTKISVIVGAFIPFNNKRKSSEYHKLRPLFINVYADE